MSSPLASAVARIRRHGDAAARSLHELGWEVETWASRPQDPSPAEVHEVARALAAALQGTSRVADALAQQATRADDDERAAAAEAAGRALDDAARALAAFGRSMAETNLELDAWGEETQPRREGHGH